TCLGEEFPTRALLAQRRAHRQLARSLARCRRHTPSQRTPSSQATSNVEQGNAARMAQQPRGFKIRMSPKSSTDTIDWRGTSERKRKPCPWGPREGFPVARSGARSWFAVDEALLAAWPPPPPPPPSITRLGRPASRRGPADGPWPSRNKRPRVGGGGPSCRLSARPACNHSRGPDATPFDTAAVRPGCTRGACPSRPSLAEQNKFIDESPPTPVG
ncbi:Hypothetical predicted protein, partial [Olea europaea subsp. europaea]